MKVWVATKGVYSDYSVLGVFSTREAAKSVSDQYEGYSGGNDPDCYEVDELAGGYKKTSLVCEINKKTGDIISQDVCQGWEVVPKNARVPAHNSAYVFGPPPKHNEFIRGSHT